LANPTDEKIDPAVLQQHEQYILDNFKNFVEASGIAEAVPIRFDLITEPLLLAKTLDSIDGVLFPGGGLQTKFYDKMTPAARLLQETASEIVRYAIMNNMPVMGIC
jgi:gamma-glutamyl-gamma-aminobutyrate hydrolase PuuD